ncbi:MAG: hypothetical protein ACPGVD_11925, partial [Flavobacteriales bacterium]
MKNYFYIWILISGIFACKKDEPPINCDVESIPTWQRFEGEYKVYDTVGNFLYEMEITHFTGINNSGNEVDSFLIENFIDTFDFKVHYSLKSNLNFFDYGVNDSIPDQQGKHWFLDVFFNDPLFFSSPLYTYERRIKVDGRL